MTKLKICNRCGKYQHVATDEKSQPVTLVAWKEGEEGSDETLVVMDGVARKYEPQRNPRHYMLSRYSVHTCPAPAEEILETTPAGDPESTETPKTPARVEGAPDGAGAGTEALGSAGPAGKQ